MEYSRSSRMDLTLYDCGLQGLLLGTSGAPGWDLTLYHIGLQSLLLGTSQSSRMGFDSVSHWPTESVITD